MKRKIKPVDLNDFLEADDINTTSIKGEMRKLWPAIHHKLTTGGWTARDVVKWFNDQGVSMSVELFRVYLNELDRENRYRRSQNKFLNAQAQPVFAEPQTRHSNSKQIAPVQAPQVSTPSSKPRAIKTRGTSPESITRILNQKINLSDFIK